MADDIALNTVESPEGAAVFVPSSGGISIDLTQEQSSPDEETSYEPSTLAELQAKYSALANLYPTTPKTDPAPSFNTKGKVICFDTETTGVTPLDSRLVVASFWDLSKGPETMTTFAGWDEEILINEIASYLNAEQPETLVAYNIGFDLNFFLTRMMAFGVRCPTMKKMKLYDIMTIFAQGGESYAKPISKVGTAEDWLNYFYGETKPFTIDELLEGFKNGDLVPAIVRNHACVYAEGRFYQLIQEVYGGPDEFVDQLVPTLSVGSGNLAFQSNTVVCPVCLTNNVCKGGSSKQACVVCRTDITELCRSARS